MDDANVLYDLGIAYSELGRYEDAVTRLKMSIALEPSHSNAWVGIGVAYTRLKRAKDAKEAFNKANFSGACSPRHARTTALASGGLKTPRRFQVASTRCNFKIVKACLACKASSSAPDKA